MSKVHIQENETHNLSSNIPVELYQEIKIKAVRQRCKMTDLIIQYLQEGLDRSEQKEAA